MAEKFEYTREWTDAEAFPLLGFTKSWENPSDYPTIELDETKVRKDMQSLHDEVKDYINNKLIPAVLSEEATEAARAAAEAQREANENQRIENENTRISAEQTRVASETTRQNNEASRVAAEQARADENTGIVAQATAQANIASAAATSAGNSASAASASANAAAGSASAALSSEQNAKSSENSAKSSETAAKASETAAKDSETSAQGWASFAQAQAESVTVPAAEGVYNVVLQDRAVASDRYALIVENGVLKLLGVKNTLDAATPTLIDTSSGTGWKLAVNNGKLLIEEV